MIQNLRKGLRFMVFDATISLGNILTAGGTVGGLLWAYHKWDKRIEIRHVNNLNEFAKMNVKMDRVESKVDETRRDVNGSRQKLEALDTKVEKHLVADDLVQRELMRRLDKLDGE
jgi:hypothetical protein